MQTCITHFVDNPSFKDNLKGGAQKVEQQPALASYDIINYKYSEITDYRPRAGFKTENRL